jgi:hypothetical protein
VYPVTDSVTFRAAPNYSTAYDRLADKLLPPIQEPILKQHKVIVYAIATDMRDTGEVMHDLWHPSSSTISFYMAFASVIRADAVGNKWPSHQLAEITTEPGTLIKAYNFHLTGSDFPRLRRIIIRSLSKETKPDLSPGIFRVTGLIISEIVG